MTRKPLVDPQGRPFHPQPQFRFTDTVCTTSTAMLPGVVYDYSTVTTQNDNVARWFMSDDVAKYMAEPIAPEPTTVWQRIAAWVFQKKEKV